MAMTTEGSRQEQNPIMFGAERIKEITQTLVRQQMQGIFPRNYVYAVGNYNLIFLPMILHGDQADGFAQAADMIALNPNEEFKSGLVRQEDLDSRTRWHFRDATLKDATDLQIVKYGSRLISNLFSHLQSEILEYEDPERIGRGLKALDTRELTQTQIAGISRRALNEMGEIGETEVSVPTDVGVKMIAEIDDVISRKGMKAKSPDLEKMRKAFRLYENRNGLVEGIRLVASNMRARSVEDRLVSLVNQAIDINTVDEVRKDGDGEVWFVPRETGNKLGNYRGQPIFVRHSPDEGWIMVVSKSGVKEVRQYIPSDSPRWCAEHVLEKAGPIAQTIIGRAIGEVFPNLKWQDIKPLTKHI